MTQQEASRILSDLQRQQGRELTPQEANRALSDLQRQQGRELTPQEASRALRDLQRPQGRELTPQEASIEAEFMQSNIHFAANVSSIFHGNLPDLPDLHTLAPQRQQGHELISPQDAARILSDLQGHGGRELTPRKAYEQAGRPAPWGPSGTASGVAPQLVPPGLVTLESATVGGAPVDVAVTLHDERWQAQHRNWLERVAEVRGVAPLVDALQHGQNTAEERLAALAERCWHIEAEAARDRERAAAEAKTRRAAESRVEELTHKLKDAEEELERARSDTARAEHVNHRLSLELMDVRARPPSSPALLKLAPPPAQDTGSAWDVRTDKAEELAAAQEQARRARLEVAEATQRADDLESALQRARWTDNALSADLDAAMSRNDALEQDRARLAGLREQLRGIPELLRLCAQAAAAGDRAAEAGRASREALRAHGEQVRACVLEARRNLEERSRDLLPPRGSQVHGAVGRALAALQEAQDDCARALEPATAPLPSDRDVSRLVEAVPAVDGEAVAEAVRAITEVDNALNLC